MTNLQTDPSQKSMPIWVILREAVAQVWVRRTYFGKLMLLPMVFTGITGYMEDLWYQSNIEQPIVQLLSEQVIFAVLYAAFFALFAVVIHRSILLNEQASPSRWFLRVSRREITFIGWSFLIGGGMWLMFAIGAALSTALALPFATWYPGLFGRIENAHPWLGGPGWLTIIVVGGSVAGFSVSYFAARTSLLLPATALDNHQKLGWAWTISKPHDMRLAFLVGVIPLASLLFQALGSIWISDLLWSPVHHILSTSVYCSLLVMEIAILSLSYRWITESVPLVSPLP